MKPLFLFAAAIYLCGMSTPSYAQSSEYETALRGEAMEARLGITIPFGGDGKSKKSKPELALIGRRTHSNGASNDWTLKPDLTRNNYVENRLALTLSAEPELRLNGQEIYGFGGEGAHLSDDVQTAGKVALGAGILVATVIAVRVAIYILAIATTDEPLDGG